MSAEDAEGAENFNGFLIREGARRDAKNIFLLAAEGAEGDARVDREIGGRGLGGTPEVPGACVS